MNVIIVCIQQSDFLRVTFPRSKRSLPDAKFTVLTSNEDSETITVCNGLQIPVIQISKELLTFNGAQFNFSALGSYAHTYSLASSPANQKPWTLLTRANIVLDAKLAALDFLHMDPQSLYGCGLQSITTTQELVTFQCKEPTPSEVREIVPGVEFLLWKNGGKFSVWSSCVKEALHDFTKSFETQYIVQLKLAHLGEIGEDVEERKSARWGEIRKTRVEPVHAGTPNHPSAPAAVPAPTPTSSAPAPVAAPVTAPVLTLPTPVPTPVPAPVPESPPKQEHVKPENLLKPQTAKRFGFLIDVEEQDVDNGRSEIDSQQNVPQRKEDDEMFPTRRARKSPWAPVENL